MIEPAVARQLEPAKNSLFGLDIDATDVYLLNPALGIFWQHLICHITDIPCKIPKWRPCYVAYFFLRRQKHVPLLNYFRRRWDARLIGVMLGVFLFQFYYLISLTLHFDVPKQPSLLETFFWFYMIGVTWLLFSVSILHWRLRQIEKTCALCYEKLGLSMADAIRFAARRQRQQQQQAATGAGTASP